MRGLAKSFVAIHGIIGILENSGVILAVFVYAQAARYRYRQLMAIYGEMLSGAAFVKPGQ